MRVDATNVRMTVAPGLINALAGIQQNSSKMAGRCLCSLDNEFQTFADGMATFIGHAKRADLEEPQKREAFNFRMLNTGGFFGVSYSLFEGVFAAVDMRKKGIEALAAALLDLFLEYLFSYLDEMKKAKREAGNSEAMEQSAREMETKYISKAIEGFQARIGEAFELMGKKVTAAQQVLDRAVGLIEKAAAKADEHLDWMLKQVDKGKQVPLKAQENFEKDFEAMLALREKEAAAKKELIRSQQEMAVLDSMKDRTAGLLNTEGEAAERWAKLFGPGSEGEKILTQAREQFQKEVEQYRSLRSGELEGLSQRVAALPAEQRGAVERYLAQSKQNLEEWATKDLNMTLTFSSSQDLTSAVTGKMAQLHALGEEQKSNMHTGWFYTTWCWAWDKIKEGCAAVWNPVAGWVKDNTPSFLVGGITVFWSWFSWAVTGFFWLVMEFFKLIAELVGYLANLRSVTYLESNYRTQGQAVMVSKGVPKEHFEASNTEEVIKGVVNDSDPENLPGNLDKAAAQAMKAQLLDKAKAKARDEQAAHKDAYGKAVMDLCKQALDPARLKKEGTVARYEEAKVQNVIFTITSTMQDYQQQFKYNDAGFFDAVGMKIDELWNGCSATWPAIANVFALVGSQGSLLMRGLAGGLLFFGFVGVVTAAAVYEVAELLEKGAVWLRAIVCAVGTIPCVNAFGSDLMAMQGITYQAMIEEVLDLPHPDVGVDPKTGAPKRY